MAHLNEPGAISDHSAVGLDLWPNKRLNRLRTHCLAGHDPAGLLLLRTTNERNNNYEFLFLSKRVMRPKKRVETSVAGEWLARIFILLLSIFPYLVIVSSVPAQTATGVIRGTVQDSTGAYIVEVNVLLIDRARNQSWRQTTNEDALAQDNSGTVWVGDEGKICSWNNGVAALYSRPTDAACKPAIGSLLADFDQSILIGCEGGLRRLAQGRFVPFRPAALDADKLRGSKLLYDRSGGLWVGTTNNGLYHVSNGAADHFEVADGLSDDSVSDENSPGLDESLLRRREDGGGL